MYMLYVVEGLYQYQLYVHVSVKPDHLHPETMHLSIKTTWLCPNSACTLDFDLSKETTSPFDHYRHGFLYL